MPARLLRLLAGRALERRAVSAAALELLAAAYGRRIHGRRLRIPCPAHGGTGDNLSLWEDRPGDGIGAVCFSGGCSWTDIRAALLRDAGIDIGSERADPRAAARRTAPAMIVCQRRGNRPAKPAPRSQDRPDMREHARRLWARCLPIPQDGNHPARQWLAARALWRPRFPLPSSIRWLPAALHDGAAHTGAGSLVALAAPPGAWLAAWPGLPAAAAVQLVAVDTQGKPALDRPADKGGLGKRTYGPSAGAVVMIGCPAPDYAAGPVRVAEGVADALALAARFAGPAIATLGTSGASAEALARFLADWTAGTVIHADADADGQRAAAALRRAVEKLGGRCKAVLPSGDAKDAGAVAAPFDPLPDGWESYAATLRSVYPDWPRYEIARQSVTLCLADGDFHSHTTEDDV